MVVGAVAFLNGLGSLTLLAALSDDPNDRMFELNVAIGTAVVTITLGGVLCYHAASALGGQGSRAIPALARVGHEMPGKAMSPRAAVGLLVTAAVVFAAAVALGQFLINDTGRAPWLFPFVNVAAVSIPSMLVASTVCYRYVRTNDWAWPVSWREGTTGFIYGAIGATMIASVINTIALVGLGVLLVATKGEGSATDLADNLPTVPRAWGIAYDLTILCVVAPLNEEFWKGMIVAFFFFRRGGPARCFMWGVLAGTGFNLLETFQNSLVVINPDQLAEQTISGQWWYQFALPRAGTALVHGSASGLSALGFYGLFRREWRFALLYFGGVTVHATWNFLAYVLGGDAFFSQAGPDSAALDVLAVIGMCAWLVLCVILIVAVPRWIRDGVPAPVYRLLRATPVVGSAGPAPPERSPLVGVGS